MKKYLCEREIIVLINYVWIRKQWFFFYKSSISALSPTNSFDSSDDNIRLSSPTFSEEEEEQSILRNTNIIDNWLAPLPTKSVSASEGKISTLSKGEEQQFFLGNNTNIIDNRLAPLPTKSFSASEGNISTLNKGEEQQFFLGNSNINNTTYNPPISLQIEAHQTTKKYKNKEDQSKNKERKGQNIKGINYLSCDDIKQIFQEKNQNNYSFIDSLFKEEPKLIAAEEEMELLRRKRIRDDYNLDEDTGENRKFQRGRKKKDDPTERVHNKYKSDNIIKKVKTYLFKYLVKYFNAFCDDSTSVKELNYGNYINHVRKKDNLEYLNMSLKDLLSLEISPKHKHFEENYNKTTLMK